MRDVMVDLETLGQSPGCAILSIGAVAFDPGSGTFGDTFYSVVGARSCRALGLREEADTVAWWDKQSPEARTVLAEAEASPVTLGEALFGFSAYLDRHGGPKAVRVWGNGADFDNAILAHLYGLLRIPLPWSFWNSRCFRTLKNLDHTPAPARAGTHHNALDDARHQAQHACRIYAHMAAGQMRMPVDPAPG